MDYEWKIKQLEEEARHEKAMRELQGDRLDTHDHSIGLILGMLERTAKNVEVMSELQIATQIMLQDLIKLMIKPGTNGGKADGEPA